MIRAFLSAGATFVGLRLWGCVCGVAFVGLRLWGCGEREPCYILAEADPDDKVKIRGFLSWVEDFVFGFATSLRVVCGIHRYSGFPWGTSIAPHVS